MKQSLSPRSCEHQKDNKGTLWTILYILIWQLRWNRPISQKTQTDTIT